MDGWLVAFVLWFIGGIRTRDVFWPINDTWSLLRLLYWALR